MPTPWQRDLEADAPKFEAWLRRKLDDASEVRMSPLVAPQSSGFSNETLLFDLAWTENGTAREQPMVVRIQPTGYQVFPEYDLGLQFRTMQRLAPTDVPERRRSAAAEAPSEPADDGAEPEPATGPTPGDVEVAPAQRRAD